MPACCIKGCGARKNINQPQLTLHQFPRNGLLRRKWLDVIGIENINHRHKKWHVCSLHFDESCFNRTLTVMRLRDNAVPSCSLLPFQQHHQSSAEIIEPLQELPLENQLNNEDNVKDPLQNAMDRANEQPLENQLNNEDNVKEPLQNALDRANEQIQQLTEQINKLKEKCKKWQKHAKSLSEKVRRRDKKIAVFSDIIEDVKERNLINSQESILLEDCAGARPQDFLKQDRSGHETSVNEQADFVIWTVT